MIPGEIGIWEGTSGEAPCLVLRVLLSRWCGKAWLTLDFLTVISGDFAREIDIDPPGASKQPVRGAWAGGLVRALRAVVSSRWKEQEAGARREPRPPGGERCGSGARRFRRDARG